MADRPSLHWRAEGLVRLMSMRPEGLSIVLDCQTIRIASKHFRGRYFVLGLCIQQRLARRLERAIRVGDVVSLGGCFRRRPYEVDLLVKEALGELQFVIARWLLLGRGGVVTHALRRAVSNSVDHDR